MEKNIKSPKYKTKGQVFKSLGQQIYQNNICNSYNKTAIKLINHLTYLSSAFSSQAVNSRWFDFLKVGKQQVVFSLNEFIN